MSLEFQFFSNSAPVNPQPNGTEWLQVDKNGTGTVWYNLDDVPKLVEPFTERLQLWDSFPFDLLYNQTVITSPTTPVITKARNFNDIELEL